MSPFWSGWIMFLVVLNLGITLFLFLWGMRVKIPTFPDQTSGHVWAHGVLREGVRPLPMWWVLLSAGLFVAGFLYLALYPGFGSFKGLLGWTSHQELADDTAANATRLDATLARFSGSTIEQLARDREAAAFGQRLFIDNCAACHGREGRGNRALGAPDLVDAHWVYGGSGEVILASILDGRRGVMPPFGTTFDADAVTELANYVLSLSGAGHSPALAAKGQSSFAICSACHGVDGKGNPALGAPDLGSGAWLYGGDIETIEYTIRNGRAGIMPAWRSRIGMERSRLIAAWVYGQSREQPGDAH